MNIFYKTVRSIFCCGLLVLASNLSAADDASFFADKAAGLSEGKRLTLAQDALRMAQSLIDKGENQGKALDQLFMAKAYDPDLAQVEFELGRLYESWQVGLRSKALVHYENFTRLRPRDTRGLVHLANLYSWLGSITEAEAMFKSALQLEVNNKSWIMQQYAGFLLNYTTRFSEAHEFARDALDLMDENQRSQDAWTWRTKGLALARIGVQKDKAISDLQTAKGIFQKWNDTWQMKMIDSIIEGLK